MIAFLPIFSTVLLLLVIVDAQKLSSEENEHLQKYCGVNMKEVYRSTRKVLNGTAAHSGESPWTAAIYFKHQHKTTYTTGTIISDRHILSYDHIFLVNSSNTIHFRHNQQAIYGDDYKCDGDNLILPRDLVRNASAVFGSLRADRLSGKAFKGIKNITIVGGCVKPYVLGKLAVVELKSKLENKRPICIADHSSLTSFVFYGFGDNSDSLADARLRHTTIKKVPCKDTSRNDIFCVDAKDSLCNGDFGGGAIRKVGILVQAFGVYIAGQYDCTKPQNNVETVFANLTTYARSICDISGACTAAALEEIRREQTTTELYTTGFGTDYTTDYSGTTDSGYTTDYIGTDVYGTNQSPSATGGPDHDPVSGGCEEDNEEDVIHIDIHLKKYKKTGNKSDIKTVIRGLGK